MGEIVTFYSYKGGTGRSMALANVAWILATNNKSVLVIDWDLEAPGLHRYFRPFLADKDLVSPSSRGVIDFVFDFALQAATPPATEGERRDAAWYQARANILRYATSLRWRFGERGTIDYVPPGKQEPTYASRVNSFNWENFYERLGGGHFLSAARAAMKERYDYVLIDSRTGVSDTSGICTVLMPDVLVVCFTLNNQSIEGASAVAASAAAQRRGSDGALSLRVLPVPMRVEAGEKRKLERRRRYAKSAFASFIGERDPYWGDVEIPYEPFYGYEETLAAFEDEPGRVNTVLAGMERLTRHITQGAVARLIPPSDADRAQVIAEFERLPQLEAVAPTPAPASRWPRIAAYAATIAWLALVAGVVAWLASSFERPGRARAAAIAAYAERELRSGNIAHAALFLAEADGLPEPEGGRELARRVAASGIPWFVLLEEGDATAIEFSPNGKLLVTTGGSGRTRLWDASNGNLYMELSAGAYRVRSVAFSPDSMRLLTSDVEGTLRVRDTATGRVVWRGRWSDQQSRRTPGGPERLFLASAPDRPSDVTVRFAADGAALVVVREEPTGKDARAVVLKIPIGDATRPSPIVGFSVPKPATWPDPALVLSPDARVLLSAPTGTAYQVLSTSDGGVVTLQGALRPLQGASFAADSRSFLLYNSRLAQIWDVQSGKLLSEAGLPALPRAAALGTVPGAAAFATAAGEITLFASNDLRRLRTLVMPDEARSVSFGPAGNMLAAAMQGGVLVWRLDAPMRPAKDEWPDWIDYLRKSTAACLPADVRAAALLESATVAADRYARCEAAHGRRTGKILDLTRPAANWAAGPGEVNPVCSPPNPRERAFVDDATPEGPAVTLHSTADRVDCCTCTRRTASFPLSETLNTDRAVLHGWLEATRGKQDVYSVASMQVDLFRSGSRVAARVYAGENRPNNNCAIERPETLIESAAPFDLPLSTIRPNAEFDEVRVHLQGYACGPAGNSITLGGLRLKY